MGVERRPGACGQVGVCRKNGQTRPVYACLAGDAGSVIAAARSMDGNGTGGCFLTPERHAGVRELLKDKRVAEVVLAEAVACADAGFTGDCGQVCAAVAGDMTVRELDRNMTQGFERVVTVRHDDGRKIRQQREAIEDMADGPDRFLAGLQGQLTEKQRELFFALIEKIDDGAVRRVRTYAEIGKMLGGVKKQAIGTRVKRLYEQHEGVADYVRAIREPEKPQDFSEMSPSDRRKHGIDKTYNYDSG